MRRPSQKKPKSRAWETHSEQSHIGNVQLKGETEESGDRT